MLNKYNLQTISFLIGSLNSVTTNFGKNSKSIEFFKQQVNALVNIGNVRAVDAEFVYKLVGMENTDAVKWDITTPRINEFINCMNYLYNMTFRSNTEIMDILIQLKNNNIMTDKTEKYIEELYDVQSNTAKLPTKGKGFGTINTKLSQDKQNCGVDPGSELERLMGIVLAITQKYRANGNITPCIRIRNTEAVCSCDPAYHYIELKYNIDENLLNILKYTFKISKDTTTIVLREVVSDGCHASRQYTLSKEYNKLFEKLDFDKLRYEMTIKREELLD